MMCILAMVAERDACAFCFAEAGAMYGINPQVLRAIAGVESNMNPAAVNKNSNNSTDIGLMQINTIWKPVLGEERWRHLDDACYNTKTGSWILATCIEKYGYNWKAIGCYNSQTPGKSEAYARRVFDRLKQLGRGKAPQPIDDDLKEAMIASLAAQVEQIGRGEKKPVVMKFTPYVRVPRSTLSSPPDPPSH